MRFLVIIYYLFAYLNNMSNAADIVLTPDKMKTSSSPGKSSNGQCQEME